MALQTMNQKYIKISLVVGLFVVLFFVLMQFAAGGDWAAVFRPHTLTLLEGRNPYDGPLFVNPPWVFLVLAPLALLPPVIGSVLFALIGAAGYLWAITRLKAKPTALIFIVLTPGFLAALFNPNFDWAVALGYTLPPQIGLFFVLTKPHISAPLVIFWLIETWRAGGFRKVLWVFAPVLAAYAISFVIFGPWVLHMGGSVNNLSNTANVWPWGLLAGSVLTTAALRLRKANLALIAGPFISPYLAPYSWLPATLGLLPSTPETVIACIAFWAAFLITNFA
jgi:hypothetical protein